MAGVLDSVAAAVESAADHGGELGALAALALALAGALVILWPEVKRCGYRAK